MLIHNNIQVDEINIIDEKKYEILKNLFYIEGALKKQQFYQFSQTSKEKILELLKFDDKNLGNEFLAKLVLAVNQPNVRELADCIESEVGINYNILRGNIFTWAENKQGYYITKENVDGFFEVNNVSQGDNCREPYSKQWWCNALFYTTEYRFTLCLFILYRVFVVRPTDKLHVEIEENMVHYLNDIYLHNEDETICIHIKSSIEQLSWKTTISEITNYFYTLVKEKKIARHILFFILM
ncbi:MAG: hypothetical protein AB2992_07250 (plasmid) [Candidatus Symbiodolus clandestinus]